MTDLANLNTFRAMNGKAPLKSWKASKAALVDAYNKEVLALKAKQEFEATPDELAVQADRPKHDDVATEEKVAQWDAEEKSRLARVKSSAKNISLKIVKTVDGGKAVVHADPRPTKEIIAEKKAKRAGTSASPVEPFELANVARALNINPKLARVKARRHLKHLQIHPDAWTFLAKDYDAVVAVLTSDHRKK